MVVRMVAGSWKGNVVLLEKGAVVCELFQGEGEFHSESVLVLADQGG